MAPRRRRRSPSTPFAGPVPVHSSHFSSPAGTEGDGREGLCAILPGAAQLKLSPGAAGKEGGRAWAALETGKRRHGLPSGQHG